MLVQLVGLREVPDRALRPIVAAATENAAASVVVDELLRPLPHISDHIHHSKWTGSFRVCVHRIWTSHAARFIGHWNGTLVPLVAPRVETSIRALRCILPLPLVG